MIRNERTFEGETVWAEEIDLDEGTVTTYEGGVVIDQRPITVEERLLYGPQPLGPEGVAATLNVVLGLWPIQDAANAVGLSPADLEAEALAWGLASD